MLNLVLAIVSSSMVSIMMRVGERRAKNNISMLSVNYFICMILSVIYTGTENMFSSGNGLSTAITLGVINGFFYIASLILFQDSVKKNGVVLSSIFMKLGIMMPLVISIVLFREMPTIVQGIGFMVAVLAIVLINLKEKSEDGSWKKESGKKPEKDVMEKSENNTNMKWGLILVLVGCGMADGMSKIYQELGTDRHEETFLVCTFIIAFLLSVILVKIKKQRYTKAELLYGAFLGVPNYYSARFLLKALGEIPAVVAYPTFSIGTIAVITLTGVIVFKEKITRRQIFAIGLIAIAVVLLN